MWKVLNAMYDIQYYTEQAVRTLFLFIHAHCTGQCCHYKIAYFFIKLYDNILPILLYQELFHG